MPAVFAGCREIDSVPGRKRETLWLMEGLRGSWGSEKTPSRKKLWRILKGLHVSTLLKNNGGKWVEIS